MFNIELLVHTIGTVKSGLPQSIIETVSSVGDVAHGQLCLLSMDSTAFR